MTATKDAIVIGGGIIGCSIALKLAQSGLSVTVFERGRAGQEASWAAAGMLSPQTDAIQRSPFFDLGMASRGM
ncbi:MAG TPA: FAD-dependent oxidoreductase, partial [Blastocatellia bacterium]|nr:FAD-dependent oxidoreductase [Blastocatellia bacterium]